MIIKFVIHEEGSIYVNDDDWEEANRVHENADVAALIHVSEEFITINDESITITGITEG